MLKRREKSSAEPSPSPEPFSSSMPIISWPPSTLTRTETIAWAKGVWSFLRRLTSQCEYVPENLRRSGCGALLASP
jgi:hypothetical protein